MAGKKAALAEKEVEDSFSNRKELQQLRNASGISMKEQCELKINLGRSIALQGWRECHAQISMAEGLTPLLEKCTGLCFSEKIVSEPGQTNAHTSDYDQEPGSPISLQVDQYQEPVSQTKKGSNVDASSHVINIQGKIATLLADLGMHRALMVEQNSC
ncbi:unnamed protein product [Natator depressus]